MSDGNRTARTSGRGQGQVARFVRERWLVILLAVLLVVFIAQNTEQASLQFFWISVNWDVWLVLLLTAAVGWVIGFLMGRNRAKRSE
jgi:uncharacterized integral membrane protein